MKILEPWKISPFTVSDTSTDVDIWIRCEYNNSLGALVYINKNQLFIYDEGFSSAQYLKSTKPEDQKIEADHLLSERYDLLGEKLAIFI